MGNTQTPLAEVLAGIAFVKGNLIWQYQSKFTLVGIYTVETISIKLMGVRIFSVIFFNITN